MPINNAIAILLALSKESMTAEQLSVLYSLDISIVKRILGELVINQLCTSTYVSKGVHSYALKKPINKISMLTLYRIFEPEMLTLCHCTKCIVPCLMHHILMEQQDKLQHYLSLFMVSSLLVKNIKIMPITIDRIRQSCYNTPVTGNKSVHSSVPVASNTVTTNRVTSKGDHLNTPAQRRCRRCDNIWTPLVYGVNQCLTCGSKNTLQYKICAFCGKEVWGDNARITDKENGVTRCKTCLYAHHKTWRDRQKRNK